MDQSSGFMKWIWVAVALVVGLGAGYYFGNIQGLAKGIAQEKSVVEARKKTAEAEAAKAINPFEQTTANPFEKSPTNPFEGVNVNPFK